MTKPIDVVALRKKYEDAELLGVVALIDYLLARQAEGRDIAKIGTENINNSGKPEEELTFIQVANLPSMHFGRLDRRSSPLADLANFCESGLENLPKKGLSIFDQVCADLAESDESKWKLILGKTEILVRQPVP